jgi:hypothetical protein
MSSKILQPVVVEIFDRMKKELGLKNDAALARFMNIHPRKLSVWKLRNFVPYELLTTVCSVNGLNLDWVITGEGDPRKTGAGQPATDRIAEKQASYGSDSLRWQVVQMLRDLDEQGVQDVKKLIEDKISAAAYRKMKEEG